MTPEEGAASGRFRQLQQVTVQIFTPSTINPGAYASGLIRNIATKMTFVRRTAIHHPCACLLRSSINLIKGMNNAMTMKPTAPPMKTINNGSSNDIIAATAESTSSS